MAGSRDGPVAVASSRVPLARAHLSLITSSHREAGTPEVPVDGLSPATQSSPRSNQTTRERRFGRLPDRQAGLELSGTDLPRTLHPHRGCDTSRWESLSLISRPFRGHGTPRPRIIPGQRAIRIVPPTSRLTIAYLGVRSEVRADLRFSIIHDHWASPSIMELRDHFAATRGPSRGHGMLRIGMRSNRSRSRRPHLGMCGAPSTSRSGDGRCGARPEAHPRRQYQLPSPHPTRRWP